jgi:hypothetical protein
MNFKPFLTILILFLIPAFVFANQENFTFECSPTEICFTKHFPGLNYFDEIIISCDAKARLFVGINSNEANIWNYDFKCPNSSFSVRIDELVKDAVLIITGNATTTISGYIKYTPLSGSQTTTTFSDFIKNDFLPETGKIISALFIPLLILTIGVSFAIILLKPFITFIKSFFK